jgi:hypothetical protein
VSEDQKLFGEAGIEQAQGFEPMVLANREPEKEEAPTYDGDKIDGLRDAAEDLTRERQEEAERPIIDRSYYNVADGSPAPENQTLSIEDAADNLTRQRNIEADAVEQQRADLLSQVVDIVRSDGQEQPQQQQVEQQPEQQVEAQPQEQAQAYPDGVDPEVADAIAKSPKLRAVLEQEVQQTEAVRQRYVQAAGEMMKMATASILTAFPELNGLSAADLPGAVKVIGQQNPQRAQEIVQAINNADRIYQASHQVQQQEAQRLQQQQQQQMQNFAQKQDRAFAESIKNEPPETVRAVKESLIEVAEKVYGIPRDQLLHLYETEPLMRSAPFQRMMYDLTKGRVARQSLAEKRVAKPIPQVQRPGVARPIGSDNDEYVASLQRDLNRTGSLKSAAKLLLAQRERKA